VKILDIFCYLCLFMFMLVEVVLDGEDFRYFLLLVSFYVHVG